MGFGEHFKAGSRFQSADVSVEEFANGGVKIKAGGAAGESANEVEVGGVEEIPRTGTARAVEAGDGNVLTGNLHILNATQQVETRGDIIAEGDLGNDGVDVDLEGALVHFLDELGDPLNGFRGAGDEEGIHPGIGNEESFADDGGTGKGRGGSGTAAAPTTAGAAVATAR